MYITFRSRNKPFHSPPNPIRLLLIYLYLCIQGIYNVIIILKVTLLYIPIHVTDVIFCSRSKNLLVIILRVYKIKLLLIYVYILWNNHRTTTLREIIIVFIILLSFINAIVYGAERGSDSCPYVRVYNIIYLYV